MTTIECRILDTGSCIVPESLVLRGAPRSKIECHALVALIRHPEAGLGLFDTGYGPLMLEETRALPWRLYRYATPLKLDPALSLREQLPRLGIGLGEIKWIVLSHLHADHAAGLRDFPGVPIYLSAEALELAREQRGIAALTRGIVPALLPTDLAERARPIFSFDGPEEPGLGATHALFGDERLRLVRLPGHARGQLGLFVKTAERELLLAADGAWLRRAIRERRMPGGMSRMMVDDFGAVESTLNNLADFAAARPEVVIVPTHCPEAYADEVGA